MRFSHAILCYYKSTDSVTFSIDSSVTSVRKYINSMRKRWNSTAIKRMRERLKPGPFFSSPSSGLGTRLGWCQRAIYAILKQKPYNFTTNTLKAYLSVQASSLSAFVISKTHISGQKPHGRQLNKKVCGSKSAIFVIHSFLSLFRPLCQTTIIRKRFKHSPSF